jgi:hypothetical protein
MSESRWVTLSEAGNRIEAEIIKEALEAQGIPAEIFQEGVMHYAYTGGKIEVCVPNERIREAKAWLVDYENGKMESMSVEEDEEDSESQEEAE